MNRKFLKTIVIAFVFTLFSTGCSSTKVLEKEPNYDLSDAEISHVVHGGKDDICDAQFDVVKLEKKMSLSENDSFYQMTMISDMEYGFYPDFEDMKINGKDASSETDNDKLYAEGEAFPIMNEDGIPARYLITLTCTEEFELEDVELYAINIDNKNYPLDVRTLYKEVSIRDIDTHLTTPSTLHFFSSEGDYYLWNEAAEKVYLDADDGYIKVAITEDSILWKSQNGSAEKLFKHIVDNSKWASYMNGDVYDSDYATLSLEEVEEHGLCLVKTGRTDVDAEKTNPPYIAYTEPGFNTIYLSIV